MSIFPKRLALILAAFLMAAQAPAINRAAAGRLMFRITLAPSIAKGNISGRLLVLMVESQRDLQQINVGFVPGSTWITGMELESFAPGSTIELDPDRLAFPRPFSQAKSGTYQVMALLDPDHSYSYHGQDAGDLTSHVAKVENLNPADAAPVQLTIDRVTSGRPKPQDTETTKLVEMQSPLLTAFWGRPIGMRAGVVLPPSFSTDPKRTYPTVYHIHGFGGDHTTAWGQATGLTKAMTEGKQGEMIHVFLDGSFPTGHHEFADSVNNGPWGRALTEEFIPHLEKAYRGIPKAYARFVTGHSSGGWSSLWLQVAYPDFFGGTWSTSPDPVDLRKFTGINATPGSTDNAFKSQDGKPKNLVRMGGKELYSIEEFVRQEEVTGEFGGQFASFEWVWSPRGQDGRPMKLFNRDTGELNQEVLQAWQKYDIRLILEKNWPVLGPKLKGKINVICGSDDTFHLEEAVILLCEFFKQKGSDAVCELVPGRDHGNLYQASPTYPEGLSSRIYKEMYAKFEKTSAEK